MRRLLSSLLFVRFVLMMSAPAFARQARDEPPSRNPVVKLIKKLLKTFGDGLVVPNP